MRTVTFRSRIEPPLIDAATLFGRGGDEDYEGAAPVRLRNEPKWQLPGAYALISGRGAIHSNMR